MPQYKFQHKDLSWTDNKINEKNFEIDEILFDGEKNINYLNKISVDGIYFEATPKAIITVKRKNPLTFELTSSNNDNPGIMLNARNVYSVKIKGANNTVENFDFSDTSYTLFKSGKNTIFSIVEINVGRLLNQLYIPYHNWYRGYKDIDKNSTSKYVYGTDDFNNTYYNIPKYSVQNKIIYGAKASDANSTTRNVCFKTEDSSINKDNWDYSSSIINIISDKYDAYQSNIANFQYNSRDHILRIDDKRYRVYDSLFIRVGGSFLRTWPIKNKNIYIDYFDTEYEIKGDIEQCRYDWSADANYFYFDYQKNGQWKTLIDLKTGNFNSEILSKVKAFTHNSTKSCSWRESVALKLNENGLPFLSATREVNFTLPSDLEFSSVNHEDKYWIPHNSVNTSKTFCFWWNRWGSNRVTLTKNISSYYNSSRRLKSSDIPLIASYKIEKPFLITDPNTNALVNSYKLNQGESVYYWGTNSSNAIYTLTNNAAESYTFELGSEVTGSNANQNNFEIEIENLDKNTPRVRFYTKTARQIEEVNEYFISNSLNAKIEISNAGGKYKTTSDIHDYYNIKQGLKIEVLNKKRYSIAYYNQEKDVIEFSPTSFGQLNVQKMTIIYKTYYINIHYTIKYQENFKFDIYAGNTKLTSGSNMIGLKGEDLFIQTGGDGTSGYFNIGTKLDSADIKENTYGFTIKLDDIINNEIEDIYITRLN